jgi:hypothetical protein
MVEPDDLSQGCQFHEFAAFPGRSGDGSVRPYIDGLGQSVVVAVAPTDNRWEHIANDCDYSFA